MTLLENYLDKYEKDQSLLSASIYSMYKDFEYEDEDKFIIDLDFMLENIYNIKIKNDKTEIRRKRMGQGEFRVKILEHYNNTCIVTGNDCIDELEALLKKQADAAESLRAKVADALLSFKDKGLTVLEKDGKVYVSMDESLLFASGKTNVEARGVEALKNVAKVLEQNVDINVLVEGHTDDVPMKGAGEIKDNWDLSVIRATSVTKIMLGAAKIDSQRITAAGRGEFFPLDPAKTPEARKEKRRTEIILTPKLDELLKVLGNN